MPQVLYFCDMVSNAEPRSQGHLNPGDQGVSFDRFELGDRLGGGLGELVRHVWVVRWTVPAGEARRQRVLAYPAYNAVVQASGADLFGADPRTSLHDLAGTSWMVGILFRPAAGVLLTDTPPVDLLGSGEPLPGAPVAEIARAMNAGADARGQLVRVLRHWLHPVSARVDHQGRLVNEACRVAEQDETILRAAELASSVGVSLRTLQRVVKHHIGVSPKWLIECRRLQRAATTLVAHPRTELAPLAAELGFSDYSHFSRRYAAVLGETPEATRQESLRRT